MLWIRDSPNIPKTDIKIQIDRYSNLYISIITS